MVAFVPGGTLDFLENHNNVINPETEALNVSNYVTTNGLPAASAFADTVEDPDNFRLQVNDPNRHQPHVEVTLQVIRNGAVWFESDYTLDQYQGGQYRGQFLRLVLGRI